MPLLLHITLRNKWKGNKFTEDVYTIGMCGDSTYQKFCIAFMEGGKVIQSTDGRELAIFAHVQ